MDKKTDQTVSQEKQTEPDMSPDLPEEDSSLAQQVLEQLHAIESEPGGHRLQLPPQLQAALVRECRVAIRCPAPIGILPCPWHLREPLLTALLGFFLPMLAPLLFGNAANTIGVSLISYTLQIAVFTLLPMFLVMEVYHMPPDGLGLRGCSWRMGLLSALSGAVLYGLSVLLSWLSALILPEQLVQESSAVTLLEACGNHWEQGALILFLVVLAPLGEEMLFRGFLLPPLLKGRSYGVALFLCGLIFSFLHFSALSFLSLLAGGIGFAFLYVRGRSLLCNVIAHSVWNAIAVILYFTLY